MAMIYTNFFYWSLFKKSVIIYEDRSKNEGFISKYGGSLIVNLAAAIIGGLITALLSHYLKL